MNKILKTGAAAALLVTGLNGCARHTGHYVQNGTFEGTGTGYNGDVTASVTFKDQKITQIEITKENETPTISDSALKKVPERMIDHQSLAVDLSTGATTSSEAVRNAVAAAITAADGEPNEWLQDHTGEDEARTVDMETQVVICGGGVSGMAAALRLRQEDIDTVVLEKSDTLGGSMKITSRADALAVSSEELKNKEIPVESPANLYKDVRAYGNDEGSEDLQHYLFSGLVDTTDWQYDILGLTYDREYIDAGYSGQALRQYDSGDSEPAELLTKEMDVSGADIMTETAFTSLLEKNGKVTGVQAKASNGNVYDITADYVLIATGNQGELLGKGGEDALPYYGVYENNGDALTIAKNENAPMAVTDGKDTVYYTGIKTDDTHAVDACTAMKAAAAEGLILVDQNGNRFINEDASAENLSNTIRDKADGKAYIVMNGHAYRTLRRAVLDDPSISISLQKDLEEGVFDERYGYEDIQEASEETGIDEKTLLNTILSFNRDSKKRSDSQFTRAAGTYGTTIDTDDELYIVPLEAYTTGSLAGLKTNASLNVLGKDEKAYENVFAIGSAVGNVFGSAAAPGAANAWAFVSARKTADIILQKEAEKKEAMAAKASASSEAEASAPAKSK